MRCARRRCARPGARCSATRPRWRPRSCWRCSSLVAVARQRPLPARAAAGARRGGGRAPAYRAAHACRCSTCCWRGRAIAREDAIRGRSAPRVRQGDGERRRQDRCATIRACSSAARISRTRGAMGRRRARARTIGGARRRVLARGRRACSSLRRALAPRRTAARRAALRDDRRATAPIAAGARCSLTLARDLRRRRACRGADGPLPRVRHRPHRQRRAVPGAQERCAPRS